MKKRIVVGASLASALLVYAALAGETLKSGPQPGSDIPGPFHVLNINGAAAGEKNCQV
jgi:hypothetical protein